MRSRCAAGGPAAGEASPGPCAAAPPPPPLPPLPSRAHALRPLLFAPVFLCQDEGDASECAEGELRARGVRPLDSMDRLTEDYLPPAGAAAGAAAGMPPAQRAAAAHALRVRAAAQAEELASLLPAIEALEESLRLAPHPSVHLYLSWLYDKTYRWPQAIEHCIAALAMEPHFGSAALSVAGALSQSGLTTHDAASVDDWLDRAEAGALQLRGTYHHTFEERGVVRLRQGRVPEAIDNLAVALRYAPWSARSGDAAVAVTLRKALMRLISSKAAAASAARARVLAQAQAEERERNRERAQDVSKRRR